VGFRLKQQAERTGGDVGPPADGTPPKNMTPENRKRPYAPPVLVQWGTLRDITQSVGNTGANDGGRGGRRRTR
jgi:hypothetical protein